MACVIYEDYLLDCADSIGGVQEVYLTEFANILSVTSSSGVVTAISKSSGKKYWTYQLEDENADFKQSHKKSIENGTVYYEQMLTWTMKKMSAKNRNNIRVVIQNKLSVIVKDNNGKYWLMGELRSARVSGVEEGTGKAMGDLSGLTVSLIAKEPLPCNEVTSGIIAALLS